MKKLLLSLFVLLATWTLQAQQYPEVSIYDIQFVDPQTLANCADSSIYENDTVITRGVVVMDGGLAQATYGRNLWIQDGTGPFSGIDLYTTGVPTPVPGTDVINLVAGDSIEITGLITSFGNEGEIVPLNISVLDFGKPVQVTPIQVSDLNDGQRINNLATGEQWEGVYVEVYNVTVSTVDFFSGGNRVSFNVQDDQGNLMNVSDRFLVQRLPANGGSFVPPNVGTVYDTLRGVIAHSGNGCTGANGRGYELYPFQESDYVLRQGSAPPQVSNITRNPVVPTSSDDVTVTCTVTDPDNGIITGVEFFYAVGVSNTNYLSLPMASVGGGSTYSATIPSSQFSDGDFVKYHICATDNDTLTGCFPDVPGNISNPLAFNVRDAGLTIRDIQFTPFDDGNSPYRGQDVTLSGIVTASAGVNGLGAVYIQQPGLTQWAGLSLVDNPDLATLARGDSITVTGEIEENFFKTRMVVFTVTNHGPASAVPAAVEINPDDFTTPTSALNEPYEGMLVKATNPAGGGIFVVDENADGDAGGGGNNFAEYRIGTSEFDPATGLRVLAGRVQGAANSSLNFSYVNDSTWLDNSGVINVDICVVEPGDTLASLSGILTYTFGQYKLLPRNNVDAEAYNGANCPEGITTSSEDALAGASLSIFPNPVRDQFTIAYTLPDAQPVKARVLDLMGRQVGQVELNGTAGEVTLSTRQWSAGAYVVVFEAENQLLSPKKIIVTR